MVSKQKEENLLTDKRNKNCFVFGYLYDFDELINKQVIVNTTAFAIRSYKKIHRV